MTADRAALAERAALRGPRSGEPVGFTIRPASAAVRAALRAQAEGGGGRHDRRRKAQAEGGDERAGATSPGTGPARAGRMTTGPRVHERKAVGGMDEQAYSDYLARIDEREAEQSQAEGLET